MKVDHEVDAQWGAALPHCEKMTGVFLLLFSPCCCPISPPSIHCKNDCELCEID